MKFLDGSWKKDTCAWEELLKEENLGKTVSIEGAVHSIRDMGEIVFLILRKKEGIFQAVCEQNGDAPSLEGCREGMFLRATGVLTKEDRAPHGRELRLTGTDVLSKPDKPLPLAIDKWKLDTSLEAKLNMRPIALGISGNGPGSRSRRDSCGPSGISLSGRFYRDPYAENRSQRRGGRRQYV